jgi:DNA-binding SARP family transcriptional activator
VIRCRTLGPLQITVDGADPPKELLWRKNSALLVYLARSPHRTRTREHLCGLLWPEKPEGSARHSLNEALRNIRRAGGDDTLIADARAVGLAEGNVELDVDVLAEALGVGDLETAGTLAAGRFMDGFGVPGCSELEDWLSFERRHWQATSVRALTGWAEELLAQGDLVGGEGAARRAQALDPLSDMAAQSVIRALALRGDRGEALAYFDDFAAGLREQLVAEPAPETSRLADRVRRERNWRRPDTVTIDEGTDRVRLIARAEHMSRASAVWAECRAIERAGLLLVEGEEGVGKTRLVEAVATRARLDGATVLAARAVPADVEIPGAGVLGLCEGGLVDSAGALDAPSGALATLCSMSAAWSEQFADEFGDVADRALPRAFGDVVLAASVQQPVVLIVDDAQWLDDASLQALELVLRDLERRAALLVLAADADGGRDVLDGFEAGCGPELPRDRVHLRRWSDEDVLELIGATLPEYDADQRARLCRRVVSDSGGIPLLAVELAEAVRDGLEIDDGGHHTAWPVAARTLEQTMPSDLPGGVRSAIRVNFRRFSEPAQSVARAATVLGARFSESEVAGLTGMSASEVGLALDELERRRWLQSEPRGYGFVAQIVRRVIAEDMLTPGQRRRFERALRDG